MNENQNELWAVVELMGHGVTAGMIRTSDIGGLLRIDVPMDGDEYRTEYYGEKAIYSIKIVSEEIARVFARPERGVVAYDEPIVPRAMYEEALQQARNLNDKLRHKVEVLSQRLVSIEASATPMIAENTLGQEEG